MTSLAFFVNYPFAPGNPSSPKSQDWYLQSFSSRDLNNVWHLPFPLESTCRVLRCLHSPPWVLRYVKCLASEVSSFNHSQAGRIFFPFTSRWDCYSFTWEVVWNKREPSFQNLLVTLKPWTRMTEGSEKEDYREREGREEREKTTSHRNWRTNTGHPQGQLPVDTEPKCHLGTIQPRGQRKIGSVCSSLIMWFV